MKHTRLDELSDGIFAIVMTILVFEIKVPVFWSEVTNQELWLELLKLIPSFLSYILSFALLFNYWKAHHFFTSVYAKNIDNTLTNINALFFMLVALVPFSTTLLGQFYNNELAVTIFGIHTILIGLSLYWMRKYVLFSPHIQNPEINHREITGSTIKTLVPVISAILAIPLAFLSVKISITLFTLAVLFNLFPYSTSLVEKFFRK